ncbi:RNA 2',3'-cyclic phosphodiesterase [Candidatus Microgenomates bacterium]|nr:RNA 2',3'-cyclic phosphodiesterase [Candidatus Microgenomates bacterium]
MTRAFIAIRPPEEIVHKIQSSINTFKKEFPTINWEDSEKLHITLVFLGFVSKEKLSSVTRILKEISTNNAPFSLSLGESMYLYKRHGDSMIVLEVHDVEEKLKNLQSQLRNELKRIEFSLSKRFSPHVTIGRLKRMRYPHEVKQLLSNIRKVETQPIGEFKVNAVNIYETTYSKHMNTSHYRLIQSFSLHLESDGVDNRNPR